MLTGWQQVLAILIFLALLAAVVGGQIALYTKLGGMW